MAELTSTRRGRPRKALLNAEVIASSKDKSGVSNRDREVGGHGEITVAKTSGQSKRVAFGRLLEMVKSEKRLVATAWHPEPELDVISKNECEVRILIGNPAYQLSSGIIIKIED